MKEKIVKIIAESLKTQGFFQRENYCKVTHEEQASFILTLLKQEIEKVENELIFIKTVPSMGDDLLKWHYDKGFKDCRQAILKILT